ncbi:DUF3900 domain-containing protein [Paenibacillus koleovorans]|uniref:DUF3900 domain-containing protein n=1 Tax=Paenibacillus koleovorans TaxID=121608 RepID=UPI000FD6D631|nr:DUF3900 domain-containing protein [Paenibacillus koleovorans]
MEFTIRYLSFFVIQTEGTDKFFKHYQTMDRDAYAGSEIKHFLDGEFARISKRKVEKHPNSEHAPTKIGRFIVEPGYDLASNPNAALFHRLRTETDKQHFFGYADELVRMYMGTNSVRGGALIVAQAQAPYVTEEPFVFVMKCDFEQKIARIADEHTLVNAVEMAISAKNMKSIQYPHMPEEGMLELWELKVHQASHARYFEDFLKFVTYEKSMPELISHQVMDMVQEYMETKWQGGGVFSADSSLTAAGADGGAGAMSPEPALHETADTTAAPARYKDVPYYYAEQREREEKELEFWAASEKRDLQQKWSPEQVIDASSRLIDELPDLDLKFKLDGTTIKTKLAEFGVSLHIARHQGRYVVLLEGDAFQFDKGFSPIELLQPEELETVVRRLGERERSSDR